MSESYRPLPAAEVLWERFSYNPLTGQLHSRETDEPRGTKAAKNHLCISIYPERFLAHRVVWKWATGKEPQGHIDHIDGNGGNNCFFNLRQASNSQNLMNRGKTAVNTSGYKGVFRNKKNWRAQIQAKGRVYCLGTYSTPEEAHEAYCRAATDLHGDFARTT